MKKIAFTFILAAFTVLAVSAQDDGFRFGFHASPTFTWMSNNSDQDAVVGKGANTAFKFGAIGEVYFRENYALKFGLNMSFGQGGSLIFNTVDSTGLALFVDSQPDILSPTTPKVKFKYQYLEIPFALKMRTNEMGSMRYFAEVPILTIGVNIAARGEIDGTDIGDFKIGKDTGIFQISWGLGGGAEYSISENTSIMAGVFFQSGMANTYFGKTGDAAIDDSKTIVNGIDIRIGVMF